ncbi:MAG: hypothetical protein LBB53_03105, partial [Prevotellaceae bacterium]|nr:hypothetical protein [Prevotellaceae bacterium]
KLDESGMFSSRRADFTDNQKAHNVFWAKYERPPLEDYWDYIIERRDLLVPQDIRERKGSYFTPKIWVELSQRYIADVLGENWQDEYVVWDCCAGTGNLLVGLTNKDNIWASTLDIQDVNVMQDRIDNGANLWKNQVFQFDFLNDEFIPVAKGGKLPDELYDIINDEEKRKKLVIYINPPYAEAGDSKQRTGTGKNKEGTTTQNATYNKYKTIIGKASNELFAQFLIRIYCEIPACWIANFSKLKNLQSNNFQYFRTTFRASLEKIFLVPADTFDNVTGQFPIGFFVWNAKIIEKFEQISADIYNKTGYFIGQKIIFSYDKGFIGKWIAEFKDKKNMSIGMLNSGRNDFQNQNIVYIKYEITDIAHALTLTLTNIIQAFIFFAVRHCIEADWLNDRDQFLYPNDGWKTDSEFQNDCLAYTLFHSQNRISSKEGTNHWIPFTETEVNSSGKFASHFMTDFIAGKIKIENENRRLFNLDNQTNYSSDKKREFSAEAQNVFSAGKELWKYYHAQKNISVNASLYDIREYFQGRNEKGKMNSKSPDEKYNKLITALRETLKKLAKKIEPKVYEYGFLLR